MDLLDLAFDQNYFVELSGVGGDLDWADAVNLYKKEYLDKCLAPNADFAKYDEFLYEKTGETKVCKIREEWTKSGDAIDLAHLHRYLTNHNEYDYKHSGHEGWRVVNENLNRLAKNDVSYLESMLSWGQSIFYPDIIKAMRNAAEEELKPDTIRIVETVAKGRNFGVDAVNDALSVLNDQLELSKRYIPITENFMFLLNDAKTQDASAIFLDGGLRKTLQEMRSIYRLADLDKQAEYLLFKQGELSQGLVSAIFSKYPIHSFDNVVVDILADNIFLPKGELDKLANQKSSNLNCRAETFIATKLLQHGRDVELRDFFVEDLLGRMGSGCPTKEGYFVKSDSGLDSLLVNLFEQLSKKEGWRPSDGLIKIITSRAGGLPDWQIAKVVDILASYGVKNQGTFKYDGELGWDGEKIANLLKSRNYGQNVIDSVVENIFANWIHPETVDRHGNSALDILLKNNDIFQLRKSMSRLIKDNNVYIVKQIGEFLEELQELNEDNSNIQNLVESGFFEKQIFKMQYDISFVKGKEFQKKENEDFRKLEESFKRQEIEHDKNAAFERIRIEESFKRASEGKVKSKKLQIYRGDNETFVQDLSEKFFAISGLEFDESGLLTSKKSEIFEKVVEIGLKPESADLSPVILRAHTPLIDWQRENFLSWVKDVARVNDDNIAEFLAVYSQAVSNEIFGKKFYPRAAQLLSILALYKSPEGGLAQVKTGEGKSLIVAGFAILNAINGRKVDVVTSSSILAQRDVVELRGLYEQFGLTVDDNIHDSGGGAKSCYLADVVYGDLLHFIGDGLRDISSEIKYGRGHDLLIVDEVDNMFIDQNNMKVQLSSTAPGFDLLSKFLIYMRGTASSIASMLQQKDDGCYVKLPFYKDAQNVNLENFDLESIERSSQEFELFPVGKDCREYAENYIEGYVESDLFAFHQPRDDRFANVPNHLEEFAKIQKDKWVESVFDSFAYGEKAEYLIVDGRNSGHKFKIIAPIDYKNTGNIQHRLQWSNGLHQSLQIKHGLTVLSEGVTSIYMSYDGFFKQYLGSIYGVTGTLGSDSSREFLVENYRLDTFIMPNFVNNGLSILPDVITHSDAEWRQEIVKAVHKEIAKQRAGLIIVETIADVEHVKADLLAANYDASQIFTYGLGAETKDYDVAGKRKLQVGDVIISTNMAGRGTDLKISLEVKNNGGLHVIMGMFSDSSRVQEQGFGRAARQGEPGSAQMIINLDEMLTKCDADIKCLKQERDFKEAFKLREDLYCKLAQLEMQDELFKKFVDLKKEIESPTGYRIILGNPGENLERGFHLYLDSVSSCDAAGQCDGTNQRVFLKIIDDSKSVETLDVTETLNVIDPRAAEHVGVILSNNKGSYLNYQDSEMVHFIAALKGHSRYEEIYARVEKEFARKWKDSYDSGAFVEEDLLKLYENGNFTQGEYVENAQLRKKFSLWVKDHDLYSNEYEVRQLVELWGIWLKRHESMLFSEECDVQNPENMIKVNEERKNYLNEEFEKFKEGILAKHKSGKLIESPFHLTNKAWKYLAIYDQQDPEDKPKRSSGGGIASMFAFLSYFFNSNKDGGENYAPARPLDSAISFLNKAMELDHIYSWQADNALAFIKLMKDGAGITRMKQAERAYDVKMDFYYDSVEVIKKIRTHIIPQYETQLAYLGAGGVAGYGSDLAVQLVGTIELYNKIVEAIGRNIDVVTGASGTQMIAIKEMIGLEDLAEDVRINDALLKRLGRESMWKLLGNDTEVEFVNKELVIQGIAASGGMMFSLSVYDLEKEKKKWYKTAIVAALGVTSICTGLWMISLGSSVFTTALGSSLVMQGIGDLAQAGISAARGQPIDLESYMKGKFMSMGVAIAAAGVMQFMSTIPSLTGGIEGMTKGIQDAVKGGSFLKNAVITHVATAVVGEVFQKINKGFVDEGDADFDAEEEVRELIEAVKAQLHKIFATDEIRHDRGLQKQLNERVGSVVAKYMGRFQDDGTRFASGVAGNIAGAVFGAYGSASYSASKMVTGGIKNADAMRKMIKGFREVIDSVAGQAMGSGHMMQLGLVNGYGSGRGEELFDLVSAQGFVNNGEINYHDCGRFATIQVAEAEGLASTCRKVAATLTSGHEGEIDSLKSRLSQMMGGAVKDIQKHEIFSPITDFAASQIGDQLGKKIIDYLNDNKEKLAAEKSKDARRKEFDDMPWLKEKPTKEMQGPPMPKKKPLSVEEAVKKIDERVKKVEKEDLPPEAKKELKEVAEKVKTEVKSYAADKGVVPSALDNAVIEAGKLAKKWLQEYVEFSENYPLIAQYGLDILSIGMQTIIAGPVGAANGLRAAATGELVSRSAVGDQITEVFQLGVHKGAEELQSRTPGLEYDEAAALTALGLIVGIVGVEGGKGVKNLLKAPEKLDWSAIKGKFSFGGKVATGKLKDLGLNQVDIDKFGKDSVTKLAEFGEFNQLINKWGKGADGQNQLLEHTIGKDSKRLASIAKHAGLEESSLVGVFEQNPTKKIEALKQFDKLFDDALRDPKSITGATHDGQKKFYHVPSKFEGGKGLTYIEYNNARLTIMIQKTKHFKDRYLGMK